MRMRVNQPRQQQLTTPHNLAFIFRRIIGRSLSQINDIPAAHTNKTLRNLKIRR